MVRQGQRGGVCCGSPPVLPNRVMLVVAFLMRLFLSSFCCCCCCWILLFQFQYQFQFQYPCHSISQIAFCHAFSTISVTRHRGRTTTGTTTSTTGSSTSSTTTCTTSTGPQPPSPSSSSSSLLLLRFSSSVPPPRRLSSKQDDDEEEGEDGKKENNNNMEDSSSNNSSSNSNSNSMMSILSQRIQQLREKENQQDQAWTQILTSRLQELKRSSRMEQQQLLLSPQALSLLSTNSTTSTSTSTTNATSNPQNKTVVVVRLPVLCFDALLPKQSLEGRTEDPTFCVFLRNLGLGGWFVMTSLDVRTRKIRRHGVVCKIVALDALVAPIMKVVQQEQQGEQQGEQQQQQQFMNTTIPTAVDFQIVGQTRCRILSTTNRSTTTTTTTSSSIMMTERIGRWRRGYDPNGEEAVLGWGDERFVDAPTPCLDSADSNGGPCSLYSSTIIEEEEAAAAAVAAAAPPPLSISEWNDLDVLVNLEALQDPVEETTNSTIQAKVEDLSMLVDEWCALASNVDTYKNTNVTAATRIRTGEPGLWVEPDKLLSRVRKQLGPRPPTSTDQSATAFCFWAAALINPLPPLGVSLEIRGRLLEAATLEQRLEILELGLRRSIDNLRGLRPL